MPSTADAANVGGYIGAAISGARALPSAMAAINDAARFAGEAISQYAGAQQGVTGILNRGMRLFNDGQTEADRRVSNAAKQAIDAGAQKVAALQESWNNAIKDAKRVDPSIRDSETQDIANGLATVGMAEGYKLGEGKIAPSPAQNIPEYESPTTRAPSIEGEEGIERFENISMAGGLGMVPFNKPGSTKLGVVASQTMDKRERDLQRYYEGEYKMTSSQEQVVDEYLDRADKAIKGGQALTGVPIGGFGFTSKAYRASVKEKINSYLNATPEEKLAMEKSNPEIIRWAAIIGEEAQSPYQDYLDWADKSGLRAPPSREGGGGGISNIATGGTSRTSVGATEPPSTQPPAPSGRRPDIYYMWDLGVNIPSPGDPNYTQYQTYLAERLAAQQAMGYV